MPQTSLQFVYIAILLNQLGGRFRVNRIRYRVCIFLDSSLDPDHLNYEINNLPNRSSEPSPTA